MQRARAGVAVALDTTGSGDAVDTSPLPDPSMIR
jgi:hypothetical protein